MAFWDNIRFPYFNMQQLNLDWILTEMKRLLGFMPDDGNVGDVLTRTSDGAEWTAPASVNMDIHGLTQDTDIAANDELPFYDVSSQGNRKVTVEDMFDDMGSDAYPQMDGTAAAGTSSKFARYDHKHPSDTSRQAALSAVQMNAVNSGAPAGAFSGGILDVSCGGTGMDDAFVGGILQQASGGTGYTNLNYFINQLGNYNSDFNADSMTGPENGFQHVQLKDGNSPTGTTMSGILITFVGGTANTQIRYQIFFNGTRMFIRNRNTSGVWQSWTTVI